MMRAMRDGVLMMCFWVQRGSVDLSQMPDFRPKTLMGLSDSDLQKWIAGWQQDTPEWIAGQVELRRRGNGIARWALVMSILSLVVSIVALATSACSPPQQDETKESAAKAADVAEVERLSTPPAIALNPQEITYADLEKHDLFGVGCYFLDGAGEKAPMLFIASDEKGWLKLDGEIAEMSSDRSSTELPYLSWSRYVGLARTVQLERKANAARSTGPETETAPGTITIRDERDRVVFKRSGAIECGA